MSKCHFFEVTSEVQKDPEDVSAGIGIKKFKYLISFRQFEVKVVRSTLTSPSPIRVKEENQSKKSIAGYLLHLISEFDSVSKFEDIFELISTYIV